MKDRRVAVLRGVFNDLVESLDATLRIERWDGTEAVPEPLQRAASQLVVRLGAATRLATGRFNGPTAVVSSLTEMSSAIRDLDQAWVEFRKARDGSASQRDDGAKALDARLDAAKAEATAW